MSHQWPGSRSFGAVAVPAMNRAKTKRILVRSRETVLFYQPSNPATTTGWSKLDPKSDFHMKRREFIKSAGGLILLAGATPWPAALAETLVKPPAGNRPFNVLFITADDMNGFMPGWMGNPLKPTPNMDAFAATAHRFTDNHDAAPICQPSRAPSRRGEKTWVSPTCASRTST